MLLLLFVTYLKRCWCCCCCGRAIVLGRGHGCVCLWCIYCGYTNTRRLNNRLLL